MKNVIYIAFFEKKLNLAKTRRRKENSSELCAFTFLRELDLEKA
jgi:hypothetical protein